MQKWAETLAAKGGWWGYGYAPHTAIHSCVLLGMLEVKRGPRSPASRRGARGKGLHGEPLSDYFLFNRWYALQAANATRRLGDGKVALFRDELLKHQDADGSWLDSSAWTGRIAGTAFGILSLSASRP